MKQSPKAIINGTKSTKNCKRVGSRWNSPLIRRNVATARQIFNKPTPFYLGFFRIGFRFAQTDDALVFLLELLNVIGLRSFIPDPRDAKKIR
jgi:hypothetical protein